jgi:bifunctional non-homologous end joining protein LigD
MPQHINPMLAVLSTLPPDPKPYSFEFKWDGVRALTYFDGRRLSMESRNLLDITPRYPELHPLADSLRGRRAILDGEVVALDENHRPSFPLLQQRMHLRDSGAIQRLMKQVPVYYIIFDLLYLDDQITVPLPFQRRRALLEGLNLSGPSWRTSPAVEGDGKSLYETAVAHAMEGIVAKKLDSPYEPGRRSPNWLKIKIVQSQEFVIGGWCPEKGDNHQRIGSLLLGYYEQKKLRYAGSVGTGFAEEILTQPPAGEKPGRVVDLMAALEASLARAKGNGNGHASASSTPTKTQRRVARSHTGDASPSHPRRRKSA